MLNRHNLEADIFRKKIQASGSVSYSFASKAKYWDKKDNRADKREHDCQ